MATAPVWFDSSGLPFAPEKAYNPTNRAVTNAKAVWDNPAGYTNPTWVYNGKAKYGTWDNYLNAVKQHGLDYVNYLVAQNEENYSKNKNSSSLSGLASAYSKAAAYPGLSSTQKSKYEKLATQYTNDYGTLKAKENASRAEKNRLAAIKDQAVAVRGALYDQSSNRYGPALESLQKTKADTYAQLESNYNKNYEAISQTYLDGLISKGQRTDLRAEAEKNFNAATDSLSKQYDAAKTAIKNQFDADYAYADSVYSGIKSEKLSPTGTYNIPKFTMPVITKGVSYSTVGIPAFEDVPYEAPPDPYAGMTPQEKMDAMEAAARARIQEAMDAGDKRIEEIQNSVWESGSLQEMMDELNRKPTMVGAVEAMDSGMAGFDGMTGTTARNLAKELAIYGNLGEIIDPSTGKPAEDPLSYLAASIWEKGFDSIYQDLQSQGINFVGAIPESFITDAAATPIIQQLFQAGGYNPDASQLPEWNDYLQKNGLEATLAKWSESGNKGSLTPEQIAAFDATVGLDDFYNLQKMQFDSNIKTILQGADIRPSYGDLSPESAISQAFSAKGVSIEDNKDRYDAWVDYANTYDVATALAKLDAQISDIYGNQPISNLITQPQEAFAPRGIFEADFSGITNVPTQEQYTTSGIYQAPSFTPAAQAPTTGLPAITSAFPTTYQPAPYTPPALIAAAPGRPTLTPAQEVIGAPDIGRPVGAPMQALTVQEAGGQFAMPTQEDYFAYFGYTPEQLNAAQYLAELEGAPRAGIAAQTVPVLPAAVAGAPAPTGMKEGGSVGGLKAAAQELQDQGRGGDTMLAHINPQEAAMLKAMGGSGTINPKTGLREFFFGRGKLIDINIGKKSQKLLTAATAALAAPYLPAIAGSSAITAGLLAGAGTMLGGGNLQQGLQTGLMAGMGASLAQGAGYTGIPGVQTPAQAAGVAGTGGSAMGAGVGSQNIQYMPSAESQAAIYNQPIQNLAPPPTESFLSKITPDLSKMDLGDAAMLGYVGMGAMGLKENQQAQREYEQYLANQTAERERRKRAGTEAFERAFAAEGGLVNFAGGGMTYAEGGGTTGATNEPRMVKGTGDGMSDSVPATIEGVQEARLANDEFVIPADVVADLGNGSSSAGAQQLYDMMDRVRQARHGTTEQPPEIDVRKIMPA